MSGATPIPEGANALAAAVQATLLELQARTGGLNELEQAEQQRILLAVERLLACARELADSGLMIKGSMGQERPHPLLKLEQELRREIADSLRKLCFTAPNRAFVERQNALHRARRAPKDNS
jgi:hypothetical protein